MTRQNPYSIDVCDEVWAVVAPYLSAAALDSWRARPGDAPLIHPILAP